MKRKIFPPVYCGFFFTAAVLAPVLAEITPTAGMKPVANAHVTLGFHRDFQTTTLAAFIDANYTEGETREIAVSGYAFDDKCIALRVATPLVCVPATKIRHVTLYLARGVQPVYSNILLQDPEATTVAFEAPIVLEGTFKVIRSK